MKDNYLYLHPTTFFFRGKNEMLLYNTLNHSFLEVKSSPILLDLQSRLMQLENSYCIRIDKSLYIQYKNFWSEIVNGGFGNLVQSSFNERPVSYPPILKINRDIDSIRYDYGKNRAGHVLQYLHEITIYLSGNKNVTDEYYKQTIYPILGNGKLSEDKLIKLINSTKGGSLTTINLLGDSQILSEYLELFQLLRNFNICVNFYILYEDFIKNENVVEIIPSDFNIVILYRDCYLKNINSSYDSVCIITTETDIETLEQFLSWNKNKDKKVEIIPIYNGENLNFFKENVFITKAEILSSKLSKQDIFTRMELNINYFGKLMILPDGHIYSNVNTLPLGTIDDSLYEIIYKELDESISWRNVRKEEPCLECRFRWICSPISNYEFVVDKYNLCSIEK